MYSYVYIYRYESEQIPSYPHLCESGSSPPMASMIPDSCQSKAQRSSRASRHVFDLGDLTFILPSKS